MDILGIELGTDLFSFADFAMQTTAKRTRPFSTVADTFYSLWFVINVWNQRGPVTTMVKFQNAQRAHFLKLFFISSEPFKIPLFTRKTLLSKFLNFLVCKDCFL